MKIETFDDVGDQLFGKPLQRENFGVGRLLIYWRTGRCQTGSHYDDQYDNHVSVERVSVGKKETERWPERERDRDGQRERERERTAIRSLVGEAYLADGVTPSAHRFLPHSNNGSITFLIAIVSAVAIVVAQPVPAPDFATMMSSFGGQFQAQPGASALQSNLLKTDIGVEFDHDTISYCRTA